MMASVEGSVKHSTNQEKKTGGARGEEKTLRRQMAHIVEAIDKKVNPQMDYVGQELSSKLMHATIILGYPLAFVAGMVTQKLRYTLYGVVLTVVACLVLVVPAWPIYRRNPVVFGERKKK